MFERDPVQQLIALHI